jgi:hypothetical protein
MAVKKLQVADLRPEVAAPAYCTSYGRMGMVWIKDADA